MSQSGSLKNCRNWYREGIVVAGVFFVFLVPIFAQNSKNPTKERCVPFTEVKLQNFSLGWHLNDVLRIVGMKRSQVVDVDTEAKGPDGKVHKEQMGLQELRYFDTGERYPGVFMISFLFYNETLMEMMVGYDGSIAWDSIEEFARAVGKPFNLDEKLWEFSKITADAGYKQDVAMFPLCDDLMLIANIGYKPEFNPITRREMKTLQVVSLSDMVIRDELREELLKLIDKKNADELRRNSHKKKVFKP